MMDIAKSKTFKNFIILNKALLFLIKLSKTAVQSVSKILHDVVFNCKKTVGMTFSSKICTRLCLEI